MPGKAKSKAQARFYFWKLGEKKGKEMVEGQDIKKLPERVRKKKS